jgi:pyrroline-5-carboxylate reductase
MAAGLLTKDRIIASAPSRQDIDNIEKLGINVTMNNEEAVKNSQVVFVAVKPHVVKRVLKEVSHCVTPDHLVISVAAGITLEKMENALPDGARVIRCMPNTPVVVREGVTIYSAGSSVHNGDRELVNYLMSSVGICQEMDEYYLDIITGLTGCGPSYMYMILDALADGGVWAGIPKNIALRLIAHTMMGSAKMVLDNGAHPAELKDAVCSPGGASIQAIQVLEKGGLRGLMMDAVQTASKRSSELSRIENGESQDYALKRR